MHPQSSTQSLNLRPRILGVDQLVPLLDGTLVPYINLDNAASTPPLTDVMETLERFMPYYSSVHRGTGFKSRLSTVVYEQAREIVARFVNADLTTNTVIFGKNTTEAINKLSYRFPLASDSIVITTQMEHHSNDLPWRRRVKVVHVRAKACGRLDEEHFDQLLAEYGQRVALVTVSGASNVTGYIQPIHRLARKAHAVGAKILVDCAQLAPHRRVDMKTDHDPEHLDFIALSAHKMYAPFGTGALIGPKQLFLQSAPEYCGGGTIDLVTLDEVYWAGLPDREEAGTPNIVGAIAMAAAAQSLMQIGMDRITKHEQELLIYALSQLKEVKGLTIYGESEPSRAAKEKVGVITLNLEGIPHALVAAILGYQGAIGVRSGRFCAHPYVAHLLGEQEQPARPLGCKNPSTPGMVRISFGCYNGRSDIDRLVSMLRRIAAGNVAADYIVHSVSGDYCPANYQEPFANHFTLTN